MLEDFIYLTFFVTPTVNGKNKNKNEKMFQIFSIKFLVYRKEKITKNGDSVHVSCKDDLSGKLVTRSLSH